MYGETIDDVMMHALNCYHGAIILLQYHFSNQRQRKVTRML